MKLPAARGDLSATIIDLLRAAPGALGVDAGEFTAAAIAVADPLADDDFQLALTVCYELHYRGFDDVDARWEWEPSLLQLRAVLEEQFEAALREQAPVPDFDGDIDVALTRLVDADDGPPLSSFLMKLGGLEHYRDFVMRRSIYHLKEADPHSWAIARTSGATKAALVEIQADEYGGGRAAAMHSTLFAATMRELGLDDSYGGYLDAVDGPTLAVTNLMSFFGLHRRLLGCVLGHLAVFEMTSTSPNRRYGNGLRRLGFDNRATRFFDVHVEADAVHEQVASVDMCGSFVRENPERRAEVLFGAACGLYLDAAFASALLTSWGWAHPARPLAAAHRDAG